MKMLKICLIYLRMILIGIIALFIAFYYRLISGIKFLTPLRFKKKKNLNGKYILITGSGSGIGKRTAIKLAKLGANMILVDVNEVNNKTTQQDIIRNGGEADIYQCDLSERENIYILFNELKQRYETIHVLINNAGVINGKKLIDSDDSIIEKTFKVNVMAHLWLIKLILPQMIDNNEGHIVSISSLLGILTMSNVCDYSASKFAVNGLIDALRHELINLKKSHVIKTSVICPYLTSTGMFNGTAHHP
jgi:all-trans-retinol dehydrogenase (NAD+)